MAQLISVEEQQDITKQIDAYLKQFFKDKMKRPRAQLCDHNEPRNNFRVMARRSQFFDLYIKFNCTHYTFNGKTSKTIVISRIGFEKTQKKSGAHLLYQLTQIAKQYGYQHMVIESVNDNSRAFAQRLGFEAYAHDPLETRWQANQYARSIQQLEIILQTYLQMRG